MIRQKVRSLLSFSLLLCFIYLLTSCESARERKILVYFQPDGKQAPAGLSVIEQIGQQNNFAVDTTSQGASLMEENLQNYSAIVFLGASGESLNVWQQTDVERFVQAGGGYVGLNASINVKYNWPWYEELLAMTKNQEVQNPEYQEMPVQLMATQEGKAAPDGVNAWAGQYDGGHVVYMDGKNVPASLDNEQMKEYLLRGIEYAIGDNHLNYGLAHSLRTPEENRFVKEVLVPGPLDEPTELAVLPDGKVIFTERKGAVKMYYPQDGSMRKIAQMNVHTQFEDGLMGIAKDPDFYYNHWIYMYYSPVGDKPVQNLSRFKLLDDSLIMSSEKVILQVDVQRQECCHTGGSIAFGPDGLLYLSTGDDTNPFQSNGYAPIDERPGRAPFDAQGSSGNTNDLRGKILRIRVNDDATYSIPDGNLFPKDDPLSRPEIFVMGTRNSYRISVDQETGWLYWGDVGPDARTDGEMGTKGYDAVKQAKKAGFYGWPYFRGNRPYRDHNFATGEVGDYFDFDGPINDSPNNTGRTKLPPFNKSFVWYPYDESPEFPIVGTGGRNAMAGPVYHYEKYEHAKNRFPEYYDDKLFIYDWIRNWIIAVTVDENGDLQRLEPFADSFDFSKIIDMEMGHDGSIYLLEYGADWFAANPDASLSRISYAEGNRAPIARIAANESIGAAPFTVQFSGEESYDYDEGDELSYVWSFTGEEKQSTEANPEFTFEKPGMYDVKLTVTDAEGSSDVQDMTIQVGNERPSVEIALTSNASFYWENHPIQYDIKVSDKEDGNLSDGGISPQRVSFAFAYSMDGAVAEDALGHQSSVNGLSLIEGSGCKACHSFEKQSVGPAYQEVAKRYETTDENKAMLVNKILKGGSGNWGDRAMPAQVVTEEEAGIIVDYLLSLDAQGASLPLSGILTPTDHIANPGGKYIFKVNYTDQGGEVVGPLAAQTVLELRDPKVEAETFDIRNSTRARSTDNTTYMGELKEGSYFAFKNIDLKSIDALKIRMGATAAGLTLNVNIDKSDGKTIATQAMPAVSSPSALREVTIPLESVPSGKHDIYFVVSGEGEAEGSIDWIYFNNPTIDKKLASK
ncbi:PQQ-dependent sugar dehydrogenase [Catalinimonas niigatensis]|uniref:PQQ-dependent sugar dehydrogenase n=1 Tax=Catalinimonas niigatensis TaxID=1397264 RepID=UPI002666996E|nr:PQQ-dependent sugar dehydrogenase [Catalinimonas niigatensis]WPP48110.1 PQQ-dependent sugar dehydrogenase [Catalinimonas niigatensis]